VKGAGVPLGSLVDALSLSENWFACSLREVGLRRLIGMGGKEARYAQSADDSRDLGQKAAIQEHQKSLQRSK
jgi:hypothetical protein